MPHIRFLIPILAVAFTSPALAAPGFALPTLSLDPALLSYLTHFEECAGLLVSAPQKHEKKCGPSRSGPIFVHAGGDGSVPKKSIP